ncbi:two-component system response regulator [Rhizobium sp. Leaf371]|uniref:response regulator n=1 Tax=Rhizobium sp. Leaf371 TaxID=1736355 RepID=UPI0007139352|nr:response regulator [Rhizobium sp. Leaf371]KQS67757.1 two-component system response regulator [Rhizobium sp. Leaf371]
MNDVASSGAPVQHALLEAVTDALGLAIFICDRNDELIFASKPIQQFYPVEDRLLARGTRLRDFLGAVFDLGVRAGTVTQSSRRRVNREEWISERVSLHWRERYDVVERIAQQRWISVRKRRLASGLCVVSMTDVSELKKKEERLALDLERAEMTEGILDGLPNPICVKDRSLKYIGVNKAFCDLHGMTADQILGRSVWDFIEPDLAEKFEKSDRMVLETGRDYSLPEQIVRANGDDCWVVTHKYRVGDAQRGLLVTCMNDVTDVVVGFEDGAISSELARSLAVKHYGAFEPAQNCHDPYRALDLHVLAHPARAAPETLVLPAEPPKAASAETCGRILVVTPDVFREAHLVVLLSGLGHEVCALRSASEVTAFLDEIRTEKLGLDLVLLHPAFAALADRVAPGKGTGADSGPSALVLDPAWTDEALEEAVFQALQAGPAQAARAIENNEPADLLQSPADWEIVLPEAGRSTSDIDVLVAEDNDINQFVFSQILEGLGLSYRIAANGEEAVRFWQQYHPQLILMDVSMPVMNGFDAARTIRAAEARLSVRTPIVAVTTQALDIDLEQARAAGMDDHIVKPISPDMIERVRNQYLKNGADYRQQR